MSSWHCVFQPDQQCQQLILLFTDLLTIISNVGVTTIVSN